jgi:hypothetical protein
LRKSVSFAQAIATIQQSGDIPTENPNLNSNSPWSPRRKSIDVISMPQRPTQVQSHIASLQLIVQIVESVVLAHDAYAMLRAHHLYVLANALENAYVFCHSVVHSVLRKDPEYISDSIEILDSTELLACMCYFKIMFLLDTSKDVGNVEVEQILIRRCYMFMSKYLKKDRIDKRLIVQLLQQIMSIDDTQFTRHLGIFYNLLVQLMLDDSKKIRSALKPVWERIGKLMGGKKLVTESAITPLPVR